MSKKTESASPDVAEVIDPDMKTLLDVSDAAEAAAAGAPEAQAAQVEEQAAQAMHSLAERNATFLATWLKIGVDGAAVKVHQDIKTRIWTDETQNRASYAVGDALAAFDVDVEAALGGANSPWVKVALAALIVVPPTLATVELTKAVYLHRKAQMDAARVAKQPEAQAPQPAAEAAPAAHADHAIVS